jgi:glycosyltransferase involved in cell wall biosynthesis
MKILSTMTAYLPVIGGAQNHTHEVNKRLVEAGHDVRVFGFWDTFRTDWLRGTTLRAYGAQKNYVHEGVPVRIAGFSASEKAAMIPWVLFYYGAMPLCARKLADRILPQLESFFPDPDIVHCGRIGREPLALASLMFAKKKGVPFVFTPYHHPRWVGWRYQVYLGIYKAADTVITLTHEEKKLLEGLGVPPENITVTGMGPLVDTHASGEKFRERHGLGQCTMVLFVGQQYEYKGVANLLEAATRIVENDPDVTFVFVGPETDFSTKAHAKFAHPRIRNLGRVSFEEKNEAYAACDIFCLPSEQESFGGVYLEAWSFKKPVIGVSIPATREVISHGIDGFVADKSAQSLQENILALLENPDLRRDFGEKGFKKIEGKFNWTTLTRQTTDIYRRLLSK